MEYNQSEEAFIEQVQSFENPEIVNRFLDLAREMIDYCGLDENDERLVCSIVKEKGKIPFIIGNRYVLVLFYEKDKLKNKYRIAFIYPFEDSKKINSGLGVFNDNGFLGYSEPFKPATDESTPQPCLVSFDFEKFTIKDNFKKKWLDTAKKELNRFVKAQMRESTHNSFFFKAVFDMEYRTTNITTKKMKLQGLVGLDTNNWLQKAIEDLTIKSKIVFWWHKMPSHKRIIDTIVLLKERLKEKGYFDLYLKSNNIFYRVQVVDLSESFDYNTKNWNEKNDVAWYNTHFQDYKDNITNRFAKILFLVNQIEKIENLTLENFLLPKGFELPRRGNLQPFFEISNESFINTFKKEASPNPMKHPLNLILYGPPGTGKTYSLKKRAIQIIEPDFKGDINAKFNALKEAGQIEFVTFHQAFAYEEFIEGLSAKTENGQISYEIKDGIFKRMAKRAKENEILASYKNNIVPFEKVFADFMKPINEGEQEEIPIKLVNKSFFVISSNEKFIQILNHNRKPYQLEIEILKKRFFTSSIERDLSFTYWYDFLGIELLKFAKEKNYLGEKIELKNYILIIDEINRANISKVFGELITLIEESKRLGASDAHTVTLPYSQDEFGVPQNLYLIGTMNTADRSIAMLDIALRRRFEFEEMMPNLHLLDGYMVGEVDLKKLLEKINQRIEFLLDRDHTIGHAYLMNVSNLEDLAKVFLNKIIPLLQEYFYDNWEKICLVLSNSKGECDLIEKRPLESKQLFKNKNSELYLLDKKISYQVKQIGDLNKAEIYKGIYEI